MDRQLATISIAVLAALLCLTGRANAGAPAAGGADAGKATYEVNCSSCHGMTGQGDGPISAALNPRPRDFSKGDFMLDANKNGSAGEDEDLKLVIKKGAMAYGGSPLMAGWPTLRWASSPP